LGAFFIVVAASVALVIQLSSRVLRPVEQLADFSERLAAGDYTISADIHSEDEFALIAERYNQVSQMAERAGRSEASQQILEQNMTELSEVAAEVGHGDLFKRAQVAADASAGLAEAMNRMLESVSRKVDKIHDCGSEVASSARNGLSTAESAAAADTRQQQELASYASSLEKLTAGLREGLGATESAVLATQQAIEVSAASGRALTDACGSARQMRAAMKSAGEHIKSLGERSLQVFQIINIINETHLLAVSAAMEASRAAQGGNGLAVLDAELRKLGEHSRNSTQSVVTLLQSIHAEANEAAAVVEQANRMAEAGAHSMEQSQQVFSQISPSLEQAATRTESTAEESRARLQEAHSLAASLQNTLRLARQSSECSQKAAASAEQVVRSTMQLHEALSRLRTTPALRAEALAAEIAAAATTSPALLGAS
jgi:methyl-accepting chemotaxis protein